MLDFVIENITQGIAENPDADIEGKRPRAEVLNDYVLQKQALILFKETLQIAKCYHRTLRRRKNGRDI